MSKITTVRVGVAGTIGQYKWVDLQQTFVPFQDKEQFKEIPHQVDLGSYVLCTDGAVCESVKLLFHPVVMNFFDNVNEDALKDLKFEQIDQVAMCFEKIAIDSAGSGVFECIATRMKHIIDGIGDLKRLIPQTQSKSLQSQLGKQLEMLLPMKDEVLKRLSYHYSNKQPSVCPSVEDKIKLFEFMWSQVTDKNISDNYKDESYRFVCYTTLPNLFDLLIDLSGIEAGHILNVVAGAVIDNWTTIPTRTHECILEGLKLVMEYYQTKLYDLGDDVLGFEHKCALLALTHHEEQNPQLIRDVIKNHEKNQHFENLLNMILNFHVTKRSCSVGLEKLIRYMAEVLVANGGKWGWYCNFMKWLYMMYGEDEEKIVNTILEHKTTTITDRFEKANRLTHFYTFDRKTSPPLAVQPIIKDQISWLF